MKICQRCRKEKSDSNFITEGNNYYLHNVCNRCRDFMTQRMNYLIGADKAFHSSAREDYEVTILYRKYLLDSKENIETLFKGNQP